MSYCSKRTDSNRSHCSNTADSGHSVVKGQAVTGHTAVKGQTRASTNFQNQEVQNFQPSKFGSEAYET